MDNKYKMPLMILAGFLILVAIYFLLRDKDNGRDEVVVSECPNTFTIYPMGALAGFVGTTYYSTAGKFFKQTKGEAFGASGQLPPKEITKEEFSEACKTYKIPTS